MTTVRAGFLEQATTCESLGSPLNGRLCRILAQMLDEGTEVGARILSWQGDSSSRGDALALRVMGGLHRLVLEGRAPALRAAYREPALFSDPALWQLMRETFEREEAFLLGALTSAPQTNEVRRSAPLAAIGHWLSARFGKPLLLSELGASAGLNLHWADWRIESPLGVMGPEVAPLTLDPEWRGVPPVISPPLIIGAAGVDLAPADPVADRLRLLSYIWPDQAERLSRTSAALDHAAANPLPVEKGDAIDWLEMRLKTPHPGAVHLVYHTVAWQYFPKSTQARGELLLAEAGRQATPDAPLARFAMEADGSGLPGAALTLDLWPEGRRMSFGRADFHGRWIDWQDPGAGEPL